MLWISLLAVALSGAAGDFELQTLAGQSATGRLVALSPTELVLETPQGRVAHSLDALSSLTRRDDSPEFRKATLAVELVDQSLLPGVDFTIKGPQAQLKLATGRTLALPTKAIRWVRFTPPGDRDTKLAEQWADVSQSKAAGDLLVVRKIGALDFLEGVQQDVDAETCKFELDGDVVPVKRNKVEGIVFFHAREAERPEVLVLLHTADGARLSVASAALEADALKLTTTAGVPMSLPVEEIARFDFSSGKLVYLSDVEPESTNFLPFLGFKEEHSTLREFYRYRRDVGFEQLPLKLDGTTYGKGLSLHSRTQLAYKLPAKYRTFKALVGIDDSVRETGSVQVEIRGDGKVIWQSEVRGSEPAKELELDIAGVKRLEFLVDYGRDQDIGDRLNLAEARVVK